MKYRLIAAMTLIAACAPDADDYPRLLPTALALAEPALPAHAAPASTPGGAARVQTAAVDRADALRGRAEALRRPVIEPATLARMGRASR